MATIHPHINFNGNAEEAFRFYQSVFGGTFVKVIRFKHIAGPEYPVPAEEAEKIMHIALPIGNALLMGNDVPAIMGRVNENENRSKIYTSAGSREEAVALFQGLSAGGSIEVPPADDPEAPYFAMFRDAYGIEWMVEYTPE
jgi:PhnB protein